LGLPIIYKTKADLIAEELLPFQYGIAHGVELIMVGHLAVPTLNRGKNIPASISKEIITDLLKGEMGFKGLVISDALNMKAVAKLFPEPGKLELEAFQAGNDLLCFSDYVKEGIEQISGNCSEDEIDAVYQKIIALKEKLGVFDFTELAVPTFNWEEHSQFQSELAKQYIQILYGNLEPATIKGIAAKEKLGHRTFFEVGKSTFVKRLNKSFGYKLKKLAIEESELVLISVFVPSHKPLNQFGMDLDSITAVKTLIDSNKCILIHFGNPLALKHFGELKNCQAVICCYQGFEEVQLETAKLFE
jgi:beta-glucosidase-like glycosyl hydrolase